MTNSTMTATTDNTTATSSVHFTTSPPEKIGTKRSAWESNEESPSVLVPSTSTTDATATARFLARSSSCSSVSSTTSRDSLILPPKRSSRERRRSATRADGSRSPSTKAKLWEQQQQYKSLPEDFLVGFDDDVDRQTLPSSSIKKSTSLLSLSLSSGEDKLLKRSHDRRRQHMEQKKKQIMPASMSSPSLISLSSLSGGGSSSSGLSCTGSTLPAIKPIKEEEVSEDSDDEEGFYIGGGDDEDEDEDENKMEEDDLLFQQMKKKQQTLLNKINKMQATITASVSSPSLSSLPALLSITNSNHQRRVPKTPTKSILKNSPSQLKFISSQLSSSSSESESESNSNSSKPERRKKRNKKMKKIKMNNDTTETTEAIGSIKMIQLNDTTEDSVSRSKRRMRTNSSSSSNSNNSNSPSISSNNSIQKTSTVLSRKHRDSALDLRSFMIKRINKNGEDVVDKSLRASSASLISMLTVKDDGDDEEEGDPTTVEDIMYNNTTEQDPLHHDDTDDDDDLDSVGEYNEDDEALSQCTSRSWSLFEKALELEKKVLESYENL